MIGSLHHIVLDTADPAGLAAFCSAMLGLPITYLSDDWIVVATSDTPSGLAFQRAPAHRPPTWPDPSSSQQFHLAVMVDDLDEASARVETLGARRFQTGDNVFAGPSGHPFPAWSVRT